MTTLQLLTSEQCSITTKNLLLQMLPTSLSQLPFWVWCNHCEPTERTNRKTCFFPNFASIAWFQKISHQTLWFGLPALCLNSMILWWPTSGRLLTGAPALSALPMLPKGTTMALKRAASRLYFFLSEKRNEADSWQLTQLIVAIICMKFYMN